MKSLEFFGRIEGGELKLSNRRAFEQMIKEQPDMEVEVIVKKKARRSTQQNRYYWGVVVWMVRHRLIELGHRFTPEDVHAFLKDKFNGTDISNDDGEVVAWIGQSTTSLNKSEFGEYIDKIAEWSSEYLGVYIPPPNSPVDELNFS